jgi:hypothetical protein
MPIVFPHDLHNYVTKQDIRNLCRSNGKAIYLPDGKELQCYNKFQDVEVNGDGFMDVIGSVANVIKDNKDTISALGSAAQAAGQIASTVTQAVKGVEEINTIKALRKKMEEESRSKKKKGDALYLPDDRHKDGGLFISLKTPVVSRGRESEITKKIAKIGKGFKIMNPS